MPAFGKFRPCGAAQPFQQADAHMCQAGVFFRLAQHFGLKILIVKRIKEKVHQVRYDRFRAFCFQQVDQVVVRGRQEFYQNLADDADTRFFDIQPWQVVKVADNAAAQLLIFVVGQDAVLGQKCGHLFFPFFVQLVGRTRDRFIGPCRIQAAHENIAKFHRIHPALQQRRSQVKARIFFQPA